MTTFASLQDGGLAAAAEPPRCNFFFLQSGETLHQTRGDERMCTPSGDPAHVPERRDAQLQFRRLNSAKCFIRTREKRSEDAKNCLMKSARVLPEVLTGGEEFYCSGISRSLQTLSTRVRTTRCAGVRAYRKNYPQFPHHSCPIEVVGGQSQWSTGEAPEHPAPPRELHPLTCLWTVAGTQSTHR